MRDMEENRFTRIVRMFAFYGFTETPLTAHELYQLIAWDWNDDDIYAIGCDCAAGLRFREALEYYPV